LRSIAPGIAAVADRDQPQNHSANLINFLIECGLFIKNLSHLLSQHIKIILSLNQIIRLPSAFCPESIRGKTLKSQKPFV